MQIAGNPISEVPVFKLISGGQSARTLPALGSQPWAPDSVAKLRSAVTD